MSRGEAVIGLDIGAHRIGVARGDFEVRIATPLPMLINSETIFEELAQLIQESRVEDVVIGLPRDARGQETTQSQISRDFAARLASRSNIKIHFQDESLTSVLAEKNLRSRKGFNEKMLHDGTLDSEAATIILQDFLDGSSNKKEARHGIV
ncbi:MAG: Holliday junction resolvase RuvX [Candidatus Nomurabacteria bacterium]|jgi:putative Holliday junction resolvase|nr:Holliday junction resolvase RuvX [Candidatus Nomurabacteria bacterium]